MSKKSNKAEDEGTARVNLYLDPALSQALDTFCLGYMQRRKKIIPGLKQAIGKAALKEWLEKHGHDFDVEL